MEAEASPGGGDSGGRSGLLEAIRAAGGAKGAGLKSIKERKAEERRRRQEEASEEAGAGAGEGQVPHQAASLESETGRGFYVYSSCLCLLVTALSFTTTAGSDKLKEFARVGVFSTVITKFN